MKLRIIGWSDNLIELEELDEFGAIKPQGFTAEFFAGHDFDGIVYLGFSDGTLVRCSYDGMWHLVPLERGSCKIEHRSGTDLEDDYSDVMTLDCVDGFSWVIFGGDIERLSGQLEFF